MPQYNHTITYHNLIAPNEIVPILLSLYRPKSVIDVGCGLGTFLKIFKQNGISEIKGLDGKWCKKDLLFQNIDPSEFLEVNMEEPIRMERKYDLAVCLEVAEHLTPNRAQSFVKDLTNLSDFVLFSAAIPRQGGDHHYNEQWLSYWEKYFNDNNYELFDVFKPIIWDNKNIFCWYKQNMVFFIKKGHCPQTIKELPKNTLQNVIHPELFEIYSDYKNQYAVKRNLRSLYKAVMYKLGLTQ